MRFLSLTFCFLFVILSHGCQQNDSYEDDGELNLDDITFTKDNDGIALLLEAVDSAFTYIDTGDEPNLFSFEVIHDNETDEIALINFEAGGFFPIVGVDSSLYFNARTHGTTYTISCSKNGKTIWEKKCSNKFACGKLAVQCLDEGGCATVCEAPQFYNPNNDIERLKRSGIPIALIRKLLPSRGYTAKLSVSNWSSSNSVTFYRFF